MLPAKSRLWEPSLAVPHQELLNCCCTLPFIYRHVDKNHVFNQGSLTSRLVPSSWPIGVPGTDRLRRPEQEQEWLPAGAGMRSRALAPSSLGELQEVEQQHPARAGSAQGGGLEETADAGITQTDVGGIPGSRGSLTTLGCI